MYQRRFQCIGTIHCNSKEPLLSSYKNCCPWVSADSDQKGITQNQVTNHNTTKARS